MGYQFIDEKKQHLHTYDRAALFGTTTIVNEVLAKNLTWWASGMAVGKLGWINSKLAPKETRIEKAGEALAMIREMDNETFLSLLDSAYKAHSERKDLAAEAGTDLHAILEKYVKDCIEKNEGRPLAVNDSKIQKFIDWALVEVDVFLWSEMYCFSKTLWVGGCTDVGFRNKKGEVFIGDFKSAKEAYFGYFAQIALYSEQIKENGGYTKDGVKVFTEANFAPKGYAIFPFGGEITPTYRFASEEWSKMARSLVDIYKLMQSSK